MASRYRARVGGRRISSSAALRRVGPPIPRSGLEAIKQKYLLQTRGKLQGQRMRIGLLKHHRANEALDDTEKKMLEHELAIARDLQANILPKRLPELPGFDVSAYYKSSREVGGDYYDFIDVDKNHVGIVIADVSGKGIPGSMVVSETRVLLRTLAPGCLSTKETLIQVNRHLYDDIIRGMFVTVYYLILNVRDRTLTLSSAGHNPLICYRLANKSCSLVNPNGLALGIDRGPIFERVIQERKLKMDPGDLILLYTDGVTESFNAKKEAYGDERLYALIRQNREMAIKELVRSIVTDVEIHQADAPQHDDITIVGVRAIPGKSPYETTFENLLG